MQLSKLFLAVAGATVLLGGLAASSSAGRLEKSSQNSRATFARLNFAGGFGTVECEVVIEGTFHTRTSAKVVGALTGYLTAATVARCARGGATINNASLPWHRRYRSFTGTLPNIAAIVDGITGVEWSIREPTFGITCTVRAAESSVIGTYALSAGVVTSAEVSGENRCGEFTGRLSGSTTNVDNRAGARLTIRLI